MLIFLADLFPKIRLIIRSVKTFYYDSNTWVFTTKLPRCKGGTLGCKTT